MLQKIELHFFKCFEQLALPLAPLTLLAGPNASGKSSVLQALVLIQQTMREHEWSHHLFFNGNSIRLGTGSDIVDKVNGRKEFGIGLTDSQENSQDQFRWVFSGERKDLSFSAETIEINDFVFRRIKLLHYLLPSDEAETHAVFLRRLRRATYLTAERIGPREIYSIDNSQSAMTVGPSGQFAVSLLYHGVDEPVLPALAIPNTPNTRLKQVEARMRQFFPGSDIDLSPVPGTTSAVFGIRNSPDTDFHRPVHAGFGLTQVFPVIVAALSARKEDIILIENPEVHLHPAAQALMGQFLADIAAAGVQVILETHSDHILNGVRRAVKAGRLAAEDAGIHFFRPRNKEAGAQVETVHLEEDGNINDWPDGFFDQFDKDMNYFAGWGA